MVSKTQNKSAFRGVLALLLVVVVIASAIQETEAGCSFKGKRYIMISSSQNHEKIGTTRPSINIFFYILQIIHYSKV